MEQSTSAKEKTSGNSVKKYLDQLSPEGKELMTPEPEMYSEIELDENELEAALREARKKKYFQQKTAAYWNDVVLSEPSYRSYTAEELSLELKKTPVNDDNLFRIDDSNREVVRLICYYLTNDPRFEANGLSLKKGLMLQGGVGVGKTMLMELLQQNQKQSFRMISTMDIVSEYTLQGHDEKRSGNNVIAKYYANLPVPIGNPYGHRHIGFCFDDLGLEERRAMNYGTAKNCMEEILWKRYEARLFTSTHITTNLSIEEIREAYGERIFDRLKEMFNQIAWPAAAPSRR